MNRHVVALAVAGSAVLTAGGAAAAPAPQAVGPDVVAWWSAANQDPAPSVPAPPDAGPHDLYVAGSNAVPVVGGLPTSTGPLALAGLDFVLPPGLVARQLRLKLSGVHPPAVTLTACQAEQPFKPAYGGAWSDVPAYDCRHAGTARLATDGSVVIDGVDRLRDGRELAVVLVPGPLDRVVLAAPDARTLTVAAAGSGVSAPAPLAPAPPVPPPAPVAPSGLAPVSGLPGPGLPATAGPAAPAVAAPAPAPARPAPAAAVRPLSRPRAALVATLLLAALAFVPIVRPRRVAAAPGLRGVGRFRSERSGTVPDLA